MQITVQELMTADPATVTPQATVADAVAVMLEHDLSEVYVVDQTGRLLGILPEFEVLKVQLHGIPASTLVETVMNCHIATVQPSQRVAQIAHHLRDGFQSQLAVVSEGRLLGQLRRRDVLRLLFALEWLDQSDSMSASPMEQAKTAPVSDTLSGPRYIKRSRALTHSR